MPNLAQAIRAATAKKRRKEQKVRAVFQQAAAKKQRKAARKRGALAAVIGPRIIQHAAATPAAKLHKSVSVIRSKIIKGAASGKARPLALQVMKAANVPPRDERGEIRSLAAFMQKVAPYRSDIWGIETISDLGDVIRDGGADCDCYTVALGTMGMSAGYPVRLKVVGNERLSHIYPEFYGRRSGQWIPADATKPGDPTAINRTWAHEVVIPIDPWMRDADFSSWLSDVGKKVFGKKAGKRLEKKANKAFSKVMKTTKTVVGFIPGGEFIGKAVDAAQVLKHAGEDPTKMSQKTINEIALSNPALAQEIMAARAQGVKGLTVGGSGQLVGTAYTDPAAAITAKSIAAGVLPSNGTTAPAAGSNMLPLLAVGAAAAYLILKK